MISRSMEPVQLQPHISLEEAAQCLAYSCLSYYTDFAIEPRVAQSFERAWGHNTLIKFPKVVGLTGPNTPGFMAFIWNDGTFKRVLIAVQGTTDSSQNANNPVSECLVPAFRLDGMTGRSGAVYRQWNRLANDVWAQVQAHPVLWAAINTERTVMTFTGHSLGAAVAEVLASNFKQLNPWRRVRLCKFASPRVGTSRWEPFLGTSVPTMSIYCGRDPIHFVPASGLRMDVNLNPLSGLAPVTIWQNLRRDHVVYRIRRDGPQWTIGFRDDGLYNEVAAVAWLASAMTPANPWFDHLVSSYRLGMMNFAASINDTLKTRFNYLELPNENIWQSVFVPGSGDWRNWNAIDTIQPEAYNPPSNDSIDENGAGGVGGEDIIEPVPLDGEGFGAGGPHDWANPTPIAPAVPRAFRRVRPLF